MKEYDSSFMDTVKKGLGKKKKKKKKTPGVKMAGVFIGNPKDTDD